MTAEVGDDAAAGARRILRGVAQGALGTLLRDGAPYVSLVNVATDHDGAPLLLLPDLADPTRNLTADPRASLLLDASCAHEDPLAGERLSVQGPLVRTAEPNPRRRYLARHPVAAMYADLRGFHFYRLAIERAHLVAGFGRIQWLEQTALLVAPAPALAAREAGIVRHMNDDHADAVAAYAHALLGLAGDRWRLTGVDPEGCDLRRGRETARLTFGQRVTDAENARAELVRLARAARSRRAAAS